MFSNDWPDIKIVVLSIWYCMPKVGYVVKDHFLLIFRVQMEVQAMVWLKFLLLKDETWWLQILEGQAIHMLGYNMET